MPLDQALVGSGLTGALALLGAAVAKCKCFVQCLQNEEVVAFRRVVVASRMPGSSRTVRCWRSTSLTKMTF